jgi:NTE family protein
VKQIWPLALARIPLKYREIFYRFESQRKPMDNHEIVLALGSGGAAGLAHIGVLRALDERGFRVRAVAGTSIGAEIGAFLAAGMTLDEMEKLATAFDWKQTLQLFMPDLPTGGLVSGEKIMDFLERGLGASRIEELQTGFVAVAADLDSGEQVIIDSGSLVDAVRASISIPAIIAPHKFDHRTLVDGGVVNPVPFDVARRRFGGPVVAVAVHAGARKNHPPAISARSRQWLARGRRLLNQPWMSRAPALRVWLEAYLADQDGGKSRAAQQWTARRVLDRALLISQAELVRLRAEVAPPDIVLAPDVGDIGVLEFYRGKEAIAAGRRVVEENLERLERLA